MGGFLCRLTTGEGIESCTHPIHLQQKGRGEVCTTKAWVSLNTLWPVTTHCVMKWIDKSQQSWIRMKEVRVHVDDVVCGLPLPSYQLILALVLSMVDTPCLFNFTVTFFFFLTMRDTVLYCAVLSVLVDKCLYTNFLAYLIKELISSNINDDPNVFIELQASVLTSISN